FADPRARLRMMAGHARPVRVAGAARGVDDDVVGEELRGLGREAELFEHPRHVGVIRGGVRVALAHDLVELRAGVLALRLEAVVPDVERFERTPEPLLDELRQLAQLERDVADTVARLTPAYHDG